VSAELDQTVHLQEEAAAWIARLRSDAASHSDKHNFSQWLNRSSAHQVAFDEVAETWTTLAACQYLESTEATLSRIDAKPAPNTHSTRAGLFDWLQPFQGGMIAACLAAAFALFITLSPSAPELEAELYQTSVGQQMSFTLSDGSIIELNTNSAIEVSYSEHHRTLNLLSGEVYFDVASNKARPFVVEIDGSTVTAVGTAFNIYREDSVNTSIIVTEGVVKVAETVDSASPKPNSVLLKAEQSIRLGKMGLGKITQSLQKHGTSWRSQTLVFDHTPLKAAVSELNRYLENPVDIAENLPSGLAVSGTFSTVVPNETLLAIADTFNLAVLKSTENTLILSAQE
jgi:transmembrane sensor